MSCEHITDAGAYALDTLDPADRARFETHLPTCEPCRQVLASVAGLPRLLDLVPPDNVEPGPPRPSEAMFERLVAAALEGRRRRRRRLTLAVAAALIVVGGAGGTAALMESRVPPGPEVVAGSAGEVHATVELRPGDAGTELRLQLTGVESHGHCRLVAVDRDGRRQVTASWEATYTGTATIDSSTTTPLARLAWLRIETDTATLLTMPVAH
jgi:hypothetical protein